MFSFSKGSRQCLGMKYVLFWLASTQHRSWADLMQHGIRRAIYSSSRTGKMVWPGSSWDHWEGCDYCAGPWSWITGKWAIEGPYEGEGAGLWIRRCPLSTVYRSYYSISSFYIFYCHFTFCESSCNMVWSEICLIPSSEICVFFPVISCVAIRWESSVLYLAKTAPHVRRSLHMTGAKNQDNYIFIHASSSWSGKLSRYGCFSSHSSALRMVACFS